jgi:hypothetical protein
VGIDRGEGDGEEETGAEEERREEGWKQRGEDERGKVTVAYHDKNVDSASTEWNAESAPNLKFSKHMMKVTRFASFQHEINSIS